jgi:hypothetical protein
MELPRPLLEEIRGVVEVVRDSGQDVVCRKRVRARVRLVREVDRLGSRFDQREGA